MDLLSDHDSDLKMFLESYNLKNFVQKPTRIARKFYQQRDDYVTSSSLIDVILHNSDLITKIDVFPCPFSDHCLVTAEINLNKNEKRDECLIGRNLSSANIFRIVDQINKINFDDVNRFDTTYKQSGYVKNCILNVINKISQIRRIKKKSRHSIDE
jgi:hypothetical protein